MGTMARILWSMSLVLGLAAAVVACATTSPGPASSLKTGATSPTAAPKTEAAPTTAAPKTEAAPAPTKPAIQWVGDKLQPMPDGFPNRNITLYSGFQAGHISDIYLRLMAEVAKRYSPVPVVVENRVTGPRLYWELLDYWNTQPGGTEGYVLGESVFTAAALRSITVDIGDYSAKDVNPVILTELTNYAFGVRADDTRFKTIQDLIQWAKTNPKKIKIGSSSVGSLVHLASMALGKAAGFDFTYLPHTGTNQAQLTLMGGGIDVAVASSIDWVGKPDLKVLLLTGNQRPGTFPNVPLAKELGYEVPFFSERGLFTHTKVQPARVAWLYELFKKSSESAEYLKRTQDQGALRMMQGPDEVRKGIDTAVTVLDPLVRELGLHKTQLKK